MDVLQPPGWPRPKGYSNGIVAEGRMVFLAGMVGWNPVTEKFETDDFAEQVRNALQAIVATLKEAGGGPEHVVRLTWFVTDKAEYLANLKRIGEAYREVMGKTYPVMGAFHVVALMEDRAKVELEATAVIPK